MRTLQLAAALNTRAFANSQASFDAAGPLCVAGAGAGLLFELEALIMTRREDSIMQRGRYAALYALLLVIGLGYFGVVEQIRCE